MAFCLLPIEHTIMRPGAKIILNILLSMHHVIYTVLPNVTKKTANKTMQILIVFIFYDDNTIK